MSPRRARRLARSYTEGGLILVAAALVVGLIPLFHGTALDGHTLLAVVFLVIASGLFVEAHLLRVAATAPGPRP